MAAAGGPAPLSGAGEGSRAGRQDTRNLARKRGRGGTGVCEMPHHKGPLWAEGPCLGGSPQGRERAGPPASLTPVFPAGAPSSLPHVRGLLLGVQDVEGGSAPGGPPWWRRRAARQRGPGGAVLGRAALALVSPHHGQWPGCTPIPSAGAVAGPPAWPGRCWRGRIGRDLGDVQKAPEHPRRRPPPTAGSRGPGLVGDCGGPAG